MHQKRLAFCLAISASFSLFPLVTLAQQEPRNYYRAPSSFAGKVVVLPIGTTFEGRIQSTIGSRQSHSGESFSVEVSAPVLANGTEVLIPSGAEVIGEVAEAIPSSAQPHDRNQYAPMGILRVQLTSLRLPDGQTYPLIGSLAPDRTRGRSSNGQLTTRKSTVAYVGTQAGFDAVNPALQPRNPRANNGKMQVLRKSEMMSDPVLGDISNPSNTNGQIRSLMRKGRDLMILRGSSITVRLDGPLKMSLGSSSAAGSIETTMTEEAAPNAGGGKHFAKNRPAQPADNGQQGEQTAQGQNPNNAPGMAEQPMQQAPPQQPVQQAAPGQQPGSEF